MLACNIKYVKVQKTKTYSKFRERERAANNLLASTYTPFAPSAQFYWLSIECTNSQTVFFHISSIHTFSLYFLHKFNCIFALRFPFFCFVKMIVCINFHTKFSFFTFKVLINYHFIQFVFLCVRVLCVVSIEIQIELWILLLACTILLPFFFRLQ